MDPKSLPVLYGLLAIILSFLLGHYLGTLRTWVKAHAELVAKTVEAEVAKVEGLWKTELARVKAAYELLVENLQKQLAAVEARAASDLEKVKAEAAAEIAKVRAEADEAVAKAQAPPVATSPAPDVPAT